VACRALLALGAGADSHKELGAVVKKLAKRWFVLRDAHDERGLPRWTSGERGRPSCRRNPNRLPAIRPGTAFVHGLAKRPLPSSVGSK
jgi:hypothetical protein